MMLAIFFSEWTKCDELRCDELKEEGRISYYIGFNTMNSKRQMIKNI